jgi:acetyl-CoA carboxylase beta subunit
MAEIKHCPKCNQIMYHQELDAQVGILWSGWVCNECDQFIDDHLIDDDLEYE